MLDMFTHAGLRDPTATEDLHGIPSDILCGARNVHLQQRDPPATRSTSVLFHHNVPLHCVWKVMFSSQFCTLSVREIIAASLLRMTASE